MYLTIRASFALALSIAFAPAAFADSLVYDIVPTQSNTLVRVGTGYRVDASPDYTELLGADEFPAFGQAVGISNTQPSPGTTLTADVGLPGNFDDGANGITISQWEVDIPNVSLASIGFFSVPLEATGSQVQPVAFNAEMTDLNITLNSPVSSMLTPSGNPNEWVWAGTADVTVSGTLNPEASIPTVQTIGLIPIPFSQMTTIALAGTFSGDFTGTEVTVGVPSDAFQDLTIDTGAVKESFDLELLGIPVVTVDILFQTVTINEITGEFVYQNDQLPIPEPGSAALLALGIAGLALRRRR